MVSLHVATLRRQLSGLYADLASKRVPDEELRQRARLLHSRWIGACVLLDKHMAHAIARLVDIGWDTGIKISAHDIAQIRRGLSQQARISKKTSPPGRSM